MAIDLKEIPFIYHLYPIYIPFISQLSIPFISHKSPTACWIGTSLWTAVAKMRLMTAAGG